MPRQARKKSGSGINHFHLLIRKAEAIIEAVSRCSNAAGVPGINTRKEGLVFGAVKREGVNGTPD